MSEWLLERASSLLAARSTRRGFLMRSSFVATALAANPLTYILRPGTAYAAACQCGNPACGCGSACCDGYTDFCCTVNNGRNECPPGTLPGGWWKADGSIYCSGPRYYIDCNATCTCSSGSYAGFCSTSCDGLTCTCAMGSCAHRAVGCRQFRYGQCHQEISQIGRIACRLVTCTPPWQIDPTCSTASFTDDATRNHTADCPPAQVGRDIALRSDGNSGWVLDGLGGLHPFGGAPGLSGPTFSFDIARRLVLRDDSSGYVLDGWGGVHSVGGAPTVAQSAYWSGWDIARDLALRADGVSGYVLDGWGGLHPFGGAPAVAQPAYWNGWDIARALALRSDGVSGWVLDGFGGVHPFGGAPEATNAPYFAQDVARDLVSSFDDRSGYVVDAAGDVFPFGQAVPIGSWTASAATTTTRALDLAPDAVSGAAATDDLVAHRFDGARVSRRVVLRSNGTSGYVLDGWGGLTPFGGAPSVSGPSWPRWDIARDLVLTGASAGYVLDGWGGLHPFGGAPAIADSAFWNGWDIARAVVLRRDGTSGYVLDGFGGVHAIGGAPDVAQTAYWSGWDIARDLALRSDGVSGWVLDGWGGLHPFGGAPDVTAAAYFPYRDVARTVVLVSDSAGYVLDASGGVHPFGGAPAVTTGVSWPGWLPARDLVLVDNVPTKGLVLDAYGGLSQIRFG